MTRTILGFVLALALLSGTVSAQNYRGTIRGMVTDPAGRLVAGAKINLTQEETNSTRIATTNSAGEYTFSLLSPGSYRIEVEQSNANKKYIHKVNLQVNQDLRVDISFAVSTVRETIEIIGSLAPLKRDSASLGTVIDNV
ncbi:MAG: carboxypeptidase-like regulatory domain-containing protein [Acidobacteria bacterium]|nr:carboxypeptidase-like regulatory domain-containing protein [Acidobacteriota bacterium]